MIQIIENPISLKEIKENALKMYGNLVKAVVDIDKEVIALYGEMHADEEQMLLTEGSKQENLWGINLYPDLFKSGFIEYDSMINLRPSQGNNSRSVDDEKVRKRIIEIVNKLVKE